MSLFFKGEILEVICDYTTPFLTTIYCNNVAYFWMALVYQKCYGICQDSIILLPTLKNS